MLHEVVVLVSNEALCTLAHDNTVAGCIVLCVCGGGEGGIERDA